MDFYLAMIGFMIAIVLALFISARPVGLSNKQFLIALAINISILVWTEVIDSYLVILIPIFLILGAYADE